MKPLTAAGVSVAITSFPLSTKAILAVLLIAPVISDTNATPPFVANQSLPAVKAVSAVVLLVDMFVVFVAMAAVLAAIAAALVVILAVLSAIKVVLASALASACPAKPCKPTKMLLTISALLSNSALLYMSSIELI